MARIRLINPDAPHDEAVAALSMAARVVWAYLPCHADREGRLLDKPFKLKLAILPIDQVDMDALLGELSDAGLIVRYEVDGYRLIQIRSFSKYQTPHRHEQESKLPVVPPTLGRKGEASPANGGRCTDIGGSTPAIGGTCPAVSDPVSDPVKDPGGDPDPERPPAILQPPATELTPYRLLDSLRIQAELRRPELGFWNPGRFAERDARDFVERIPVDKRVAFLAEVPGKIRAFFEESDDWVRKTGWPFKAFVDRYSGLGLGPRGKPKKTVDEILADEKAERERARRQEAELDRRHREMMAEINAGVSP